MLAKIATFEQPKTPLLLVPKNEGLTLLEQLTVLVLEGRCSNPNVPYLFNVSPEGRITFTRAACKSWSCPECSMKNAKTWIAKIINGINEVGGDWYFATVTAHRWHRGEKSLTNLRTNWQKLRQRMARKARKTGLEMYYTRIWEHHKDASYHMHIINNVAVNTKWLKDNAAACGMGFMAHSDEIVNAGQVAGYVAKYMLKQGKADTLRTFPHGARRIECSQNWPKWSETKSEGWYYSGDLMTSVAKAENFRKHGSIVLDLVLRNDMKKREVSIHDK